MPSHNLSGHDHRRIRPRLAALCQDHRSAAIPGGAIYTNPYTGHYSVSLPQGNTYTLTVDPGVPRVQRGDGLSVHIGTADKTK